MTDRPKPAAGSSSPPILVEAPKTDSELSNRYTGAVGPFKESDVRAELIQKMVASGLSPEEEAELETLQLAAREEVGKRVPVPFSILEAK